MKIGDEWYKDVPWHLIRDGTYLFRKRFASVEPPEEDHIIVHEDVETLKDLFRGDHYREGWFLSYHYHGEDANVCRAEKIETGLHTDFQTHIRMFDQGDGTVKLMAHVELCPIAHPKLHIKEEVYSVEGGVDNALETLQGNVDQYDVVRV